MNGEYFQSVLLNKISAEILNRKPVVCIILNQEILKYIDEKVSFEIVISTSLLCMPSDYFCATLSKPKKVMCLTSRLIGP